MSQTGTKAWTEIKPKHTKFSPPTTVRKNYRMKYCYISHLTLLNELPQLEQGFLMNMTLLSNTSSSMMSYLTYSYLYATSIGRCQLPTNIFHQLTSLVEQIKCNTSQVQATQFTPCIVVEEFYECLYGIRGIGYTIDTIYFGSTILMNACLYSMGKKEYERQNDIVSLQYLSLTRQSTTEINRKVGSERTCWLAQVISGTQTHAVASTQHEI